MNQLEIREKIKEIIVKIDDTGMDNEVITGEDADIGNMGLNSLNLIKMLVEVEKQFDIEIDLDEINPETLSSLDILSEYILNLSNS